MDFKKILFLFFLIGVSVYPQYKSSIIFSNESKVVIKFIYQERTGSTEILNKNSENVFLLAIPSKSTVSLKTIKKTTSSIALSDVYKQKNLGDGISYEKFKSIIGKPDAEIVEYLNLREYYCAVIQLNCLRINKDSRLETVTDIEIEATFSKPLNGLLEHSEAYKSIYKNKIINYDQVKELNTNFNAGIIQKDIKVIEKNIFKVKIWEDGVYKIWHDDLVNAGFDLGNINVNDISLRNEDKLLPIYINSQDSLNFSEGDFIEFWATINYSSPDYKKITKPYAEYYNRYVDTTYLFLDFNSVLKSPGINIQNKLTTSSDTVTRYTKIIHYENQERLIYFDNESPETQLPNWENGKLWTWFPSWQINNNKIQLEISDADQITNFKTTVRALSFASPVGDPSSHSFSVAINNNKLDTLIFGWGDIVNYEAVGNEGILKEGSNEYKLVNVPTDASTNWYEIDWIDIEYDKPLFFPGGEVAKFIFSLQKRTGESSSIIQIKNLSDTNLVLYRTKPTLKKFTSYNFEKVEDKYILNFSDTLAEDSKYILQHQENILTPVYKSINYKNDINTGSDQYIIISNKLLSESVKEYKDFITVQYGYDASIYYVEDIYNTYSYGYPYPEAIREFLKINYYNGTNIPEYVLLVGDANYDYKNNWLPIPSNFTKNLVPSYGNPVSDVWFTMVDSLNPLIQQYLIGRIPASSNEEVYNYLDLHKKYLTREYDDWNKRVLLYSGGYPDNPVELEALRNTNEKVKDQFENSNQKSIVNHFYKTIEPFSNFGPVNYEDYSEAIDSGALYISYLGHSGTQTWDNGINEVSQLKNLVYGSPLMTDFGCSTGKFAEPDVLSFSELFVTKDDDPNAIGYIANSSLGYLSLATAFPIVFTETILDNPGIALGELHYLSKLNYFERYGWFNPTNKVFNYGNCLIGDPAVKLKLPEFPNLSISNKLTIFDKTISNPTDSVKISLVIKNSGLFVDSTFNLQVVHIFNNKTIEEKNIITSVPHFLDTVQVNLFASNLLGNHQIHITLDNQNKIFEYNENDNKYTNSFVVFSSELRYLENDKYFSIINGQINLINPLYSPLQNVKIQLSDSKDFDNFSEYTFNLDTVITKLSLTDKIDINQRFWIKAGSENSDFNVLETFSAIYSDDSLSWKINGPAENTEMDGIVYNADKDGFSLGEEERKIRIVSAGAYDGSTAIIEIDNQDIVGYNLWGIAVAVFDSINYNLVNKKIYQGGSFQGDSLANFIHSIDTGMVVAVTIGIEGRNYFLTNDQDSPARLALKTLGSQYIDSVGYRESWCILGIKGAAVGSVPEVYHRWYQGPAIVDTTITVAKSYGVIGLPSLSKISKWENSILNAVTPDSTGLSIRSLVTSTSSIDTIIWSTQSAGQYSLRDYGLEKYSSVKNEIVFNANDKNESPILKSLGIKYLLVPELAINYQVVSVEKDTFQQGEDANLQFYVYNVGESTADSFKVTVEVVKPDNSKEKIFEEIVDSIGSEKRKKFNIAYSTTNFNGARTFAISIDTEEKVDELYEDNNFYNIPFYVVGDTTKPTMNLTIDGNDIFDGEYISSQPKIKIELSEPSLVPITDTSSISIFLNNKYVNYLGNENNVSVSFSQTNPKVTVNYTPTLEDGEYTLRVFGKDASGNVGDSSGISKSFNVQSEAKLLNVYNYPNPFNSDTYFTFKLTQIPDEIKIKVFTIAGRLIKEIELNGSQLNYDLNKIYWDGRDDDGDLIGNGVYLYKVIMDVSGKKQDVTQKLAIVR